MTTSFPALLFGLFATKRELEFVAVGSAAYWVEQFSTGYLGQVADQIETMSALLAERPRPGDKKSTFLVTFYDM